MLEILSANGIRGNALMAKKQDWSSPVMERFAVATPLREFLKRTEVKKINHSSTTQLLHYKSFLHKFALSPLVVLSLHLSKKSSLSMYLICECYQNLPVWLVLTKHVKSHH